MVISNAYAQAAAPAASAGFTDFLPLIALIAVFYFLILRPQMTRSKAQKIMLAALEKGDEIVTIGGELGRLTKVGENYLSVEIAADVTVTIQRSAVQTVLPKGTIKSI